MGLKVIVDSGEPILISAMNLVELYSRYLRQSASESEEKKSFLLTRCQFVNVNQEIALEASLLKAKHSLAISDSIILATARLNDAMLVTFDSDFKGIHGVRLLSRR